jgi:hypothetical protein
MKLCVPYEKPLISGPPANLEYLQINVGL